ncbi:MAG: hypothetical protein R3B09_04210 [Nannocystaceae bacterium]
MRTLLSLSTLALLLAACASSPTPTPSEPPAQAAPTPAPEESAAPPLDDPYAGKDTTCESAHECGERLGAPPSDAYWVCEAQRCEARGNDGAP